MSSLRTAFLVGLILILASSEAGSQGTTPQAPDLFLDEARFVADALLGPPERFLGPDAAYDWREAPCELPAICLAPPLGAVDAPGLWSACSEPPARPLPTPPSLSFDPDALVDLPFDIDNVDDPELRFFLEFYATEGRRRMSNWLARAGRYRARIEAELEAAGVPLELLWVAAVESGFDPVARSHAGALGMWQFMSHTARARGLRVDAVVDERLDFIASGRASGIYLVDLYERFGSWPLALAAYNAGHGHVRRELLEANANDFSELADYDALYSDARRYALRVTTIAIVDRNRSAMGYDAVVPDEPWQYDEVDVPGGTRLSLLGEALDMSATELRELNPSLVGNRTPADVDVWRLRIPAGTRDAFVGAFDRVRRRYGDAHELVRLRFGETVEDLAAEVGIPARVLRSINGLETMATSPYGAELIVPTRNREPARSSEVEERVVIVPRTRFDLPDRTRVFYRANPGDSLGEIARHFGVSPFEAAAWNDLDPEAALIPGFVLQIWVDASFDPSGTRLVEGPVRPVALGSADWVALQAAEEAERHSRRRTYTVRGGDTVGALAARFGVRIADIVRWNDLDDDAGIVVGQELVVGR